MSNEHFVKKILTGLSPQELMNIHSHAKTLVLARNVKGQLDISRCWVEAVLIAIAVQMSHDAQNYELTGLNDAFDPYNDGGS